MRIARLSALSACLVAGSSLAGISGLQDEFHETIDRIAGYESSADLSDPVHRLAGRVASGRVRLAWEPGRGYLLSVLRELGAPVSSQMLVFSKTSEQIDLVSPKTPRAIYMGDDVYVAWVPGSQHI